MTLEEKDKICKLYSIDKINIKEISNITKRDVSTIRKVLQDKQLYKNNINYMSEEEWANIVLDYQNGITPKELSVKYNRSSGYLINKLKQSGIYKDVLLHLSEGQWDDICSLYANGDNNEIFKRYPSLSISSLQSKMSKLKIQSGIRNYWTETEVQLLKDNYYDYDLETLYQMLNKRHSKDAIETYALKELGFKKDRFWTAEEEEILTKNYSIMTAEELHKLLPRRSIEAIRDRGIKYGLNSKYRLNTYWSNEDTDYLLNNWEMMSDVEIGEKLNKSPSSVKDRRNLLGLYRTNKDKQGYTTIKNMLRGQIWNWKKESIEACNYSCVLTGSKDFDIHHLIGFSDIFNNYLEIHPLKSMNVSDYTEQELNEICNSFVKYHDKYPLGVCVHPDLHVMFHSKYGKHNNTIEQWNDFYNQYINQ